MLSTFCRYQLERLRKFQRAGLREKLWIAHNRFLAWLPWLIRLPQGGWWLGWNDVTSSRIYLRQGFEEGEQSFLSCFLQNGMTALDIGAHHGFYTLLFSNKVGSHGSVIAFEPSPRELRKLRWNLALNRSRNVHLEPFALSSNGGMATLFVCLGQETGCNSLRPPAVSEPTQPVPVPVTTLDRYLEEHTVGPVDFIKIDVEGAELDVLKGAAKLLNCNSQPIIMCELADIRTEPWGYRSYEVYEFLETYGFRWFSVTPEGRLWPCPRREQYHENLIAIPGDKLSALAIFFEDKNASS